MSSPAQTLKEVVDIFYGVGDHFRKIEQIGRVLQNARPTPPEKPEKPRRTLRAPRAEDAPAVGAE